MPLASCHSGTEPVFFSADGQIVRGVESCFVIQTKTRTYRPTELPTNLQVAGINVHFEASPAPDVITFCGGHPIVLLHIERTQ